MEAYEVLNPTGELEELRAERERGLVARHEQRQRVIRRAYELGLERNLTLAEHFLNLEDRLQVLEGRA